MGWPQCLCLRLFQAADKKRKVVEACGQHARRAVVSYHIHYMRRRCLHTARAHVSCDPDAAGACSYSSTGWRYSRWDGTTSVPWTADGGWEDCSKQVGPLPQPRAGRRAVRGCECIDLLFCGTRDWRCDNVVVYLALCMLRQQGLWWVAVREGAGGTCSCCCGF